MKSHLDEYGDRRVVRDRSSGAASVTFERRDGQLWVVTSVPDPGLAGNTISTSTKVRHEQRELYAKELAAFLKAEKTNASH